jgi:hypothetical protein
MAKLNNKSICDPRIFLWCWLHYLHFCCVLHMHIPLQIIQNIYFFSMFLNQINNKSKSAALEWERNLEWRFRQRTSRLVVMKLMLRNCSLIKSDILQELIFDLCWLNHWILLLFFLLKVLYTTSNEPRHTKSSHMSFICYTVNVPHVKTNIMPYKHNCCPVCRPISLNLVYRVLRKILIRETLCTWQTINFNWYRDV